LVDYSFAGGQPFNRKKTITNFFENRLRAAVDLCPSFWPPVSKAESVTISFVQLTSGLWRAAAVSSDGAE
jgi:hypothetical protein